MNFPVSSQLAGNFGFPGDGFARDCLLQRRVHKPSVPGRGCAGCRPLHSPRNGTASELCPGWTYARSSASAAPCASTLWQPVETSETVSIPDGPVLFTIEDATGSGKTEAALVLTHRLTAAGRADGLFFALRTMAMANAMYTRLENADRRLFEAGSAPSLVLSHSRRSLHEGLTASILEDATDPQPGPPECATSRFA